MSQQAQQSHVIAESLLELSVNMLHGFIVALVIRSCAGKLASGRVYGMYFSDLKNFPVYWVIRYAAACYLIAAQFFRTVFVYAISMRFNNSRIAVIPKLQNLFFFYCLDNCLEHDFYSPSMRIIVMDFLVSTADKKDSCIKHESFYLKNILMSHNIRDSSGSGQERQHDGHSIQVENAESNVFHMYPCQPAMELPQHARLTPLFEQPDAIVRAVVGDLSDSQLAQYRRECRSRSVLGGRTYIFR